MTHLMQLCLPLRDNAGTPFPSAIFSAVRAELTEALGGVTAYRRAPAIGLWEEDGDEIQGDDLVLFEMMVESLDRPWWKDHPAGLARRFRQEVVRALTCEWL